MAGGAGSYDRRLRIERPTTSKDATYGSAVLTWTTVATVWANVQEMLPSRGERLAEGINIAERPARVRIRYRSDITSDMRVVDLDRGDRLMRIQTQPVEVGGRRRELEFMAADFSAQGSAP